MSAPARTVKEVLQRALNRIRRGWIKGRITFDNYAYRLKGGLHFNG